MAKRLDTSRPFAQLCPPGPGGAFLQDGTTFGADGVEVPSGPPPVSEYETRQRIIAELEDLGVKVDRRKSTPKLIEDLATARKPT